MEFGELERKSRTDSSFGNHALARIQDFGHLTE